MRVSPAIIGKSAHLLNEVQLKRKKQPRAELPPGAFGGIYHVDTGDITAFFGDPAGPVENVSHKLVRAHIPTVNKNERESFFLPATGGKSVCGKLEEPTLLCTKRFSCLHSFLLLMNEVIDSISSFEISPCMSGIS